MLFYVNKLIKGNIMFRNLNDTIKELNADVKNITNSKKAKKLRKQLLLIGLPLTIGGFFGVLISIINFATADPFTIERTGLAVRIIVPFVLFFVGATGMQLVALGLKIVITSYTSNFINETVGKNCPKCKKVLLRKKFFVVNVEKNSKKNVQSATI